MQGQETKTNIFFPRYKDEPSMVETISGISLRVQVDPQKGTLLFWSFLL